MVVSYTLGGTATAGDDYTAPDEPRELTIAAGVKTGTISIRTLDDSVLDPGETLTVTLSDATTTGNATVNATAATTTIVDDGMVTVSVAAAAETVPEGDGGRSSRSPCPVRWRVTWRSNGAPVTAPRPRTRTTPRSVAAEP